VPPRCRVTARLRDQAAHEVAERGITPAEAARHAGLSWPPVHDAFAAAADRCFRCRMPRWRTWASTSHQETTISNQPATESRLTSKTL
jgi:hypothetical protein